METVNFLLNHETILELQKSGVILDIEELYDESEQKKANLTLAPKKVSAFEFNLILAPEKVSAFELSNYFNSHTKNIVFLNELCSNYFSIASRNMSFKEQTHQYLNDTILMHKKTIHPADIVYSLIKKMITDKRKRVKKRLITEDQATEEMSGLYKTKNEQYGQLFCDKHFLRKITSHYKETCRLPASASLLKTCFEGCYDRSELLDKGILKPAPLSIHMKL